MSSNNLNNSILDRPGHPDGMTVPQGYFEDFAREMALKLPPNDLERQLEPTAPVQPSLWRRIRPYVYMAAMFAGIWCMMKMFSMIRQDSSDFNFGRSPELTAAIANEEFVYDFVDDDYSEDEILNDMYADGFNISDLQF